MGFLKVTLGFKTLKMGFFEDFTVNMGNFFRLKKYFPYMAILSKREKENALILSCTERKRVFC
jgi:hypothetical protein